MRTQAINSRRRVVFVKGRIASKLNQAQAKSKATVEIEVIAVVVEVEVEVITNNKKNKADSDAPPRSGLASDGALSCFPVTHTLTHSLDYTSTTTTQHVLKDSIWTSRHDDPNLLSMLN